LFGSRGAITEIALNPNAVWLGLVFVLSAGFAREYDGEDLSHEPWHLLVPLAASLATSLGLYTLVAAATRPKPSFNDFWRGYRQFLGLYWFTAPLAWLYAIPVERFLSAPAATSANLALLAVVSLWRVGLMIRVVSVVYSARVIAAAMVVLLFADLVALAAIYWVPKPVFSLMGGIRLTESEQIIQAVTCNVCTLGWLTLPIWFIGVVIVAVRGALRPPIWSHEPASNRPVSASLWMFALLFLGLGASLLPVFQPEQQRRYHAEQLLRGGDVRQAVAFMSRHEPSDFPPHWDPPPRIGYGERQPSMVEVIKALASEDAPWWLCRLYREKLDQQVLSKLGGHSGSFPDEELVDPWLSLWERTPDRSERVRESASAFQRLLNERSENPAHQERLRKLLIDAGPPIESNPRTK
jgi:hypothetical protein